MAYGIGLIFDQHTEAHIREGWDKLASQGFAMPLGRPGCLPHVSLILGIDTSRLDRMCERMSPSVKIVRPTFVAMRRRKPGGEVDTRR